MVVRKQRRQTQDATQDEHSHGRRGSSSPARIAANAVRWSASSPRRTGSWSKASTWSNGIFGASRAACRQASSTSLRRFIARI